VSKHENETLNQRQNATSERSAAMRLDPDTERALYTLYRDYFRAAEAEDGRDAPWRTLEPAAPGPPPSPELSAAALTAYRQDLFLPDYNTATLSRLRGSRGRAWFWTRWSYEESRHLLALHEWLIARGVATPAELDSLNDDLLAAERWSPASDDALYLFVDALLWELSEIERGEALLALAGDDEPLVELLNATLADERAQRDFMAEALRLAGARYTERVEAAIAIAAAEHESDTLTTQLHAYLDVGPQAR
jgi:acyl-[acyl-carrier-protein] desaturase